MFKLVPAESISLKTYWCADLQVAQEVAQELKERFGCDCQIVDNETNVTTVFLSRAQLRDALAHARGGIVKVREDEAIFCFKADDPFWQRRYQHQSV